MQIASIIGLRGNVNSRTDKGQTPLHFALSTLKESEAAIHLLLDQRLKHLSNAYSEMNSMLEASSTCQECDGTVCDGHGGGTREE